jgi:hypothetical protein
MTTGDCGSGAIISGDYRYLLWRIWDKRPRLLWVMLNPSTADESQNDRTLARCIGFSKREQYGGLEVVNLFAYRTPCPGELRGIRNPVGGENSRYLMEAAQRAAMHKARVVVAWGARAHEGIYKQQADIVIALLKTFADFQMYCLGTTQTGCPCHPCRVEDLRRLRRFT